MTAGRRPRQRAIMLAAALWVGALFLAPLPQAASFPQQPPVEDPLVQDAQQLAKDMGLPVEEILWRLAAQERVGELATELAAGFLTTFGGVWIEHEPEFAVVVAVTEGDSATIAPFVDGTGLQSDTRVVQVRYALEELRIWAADFLRVARDERGLAFDLTVDTPTNEIVVFYEDPKTEIDLRDALQVLPSAVDVGAFSFRQVPELASPTVNIYAGLSLTTCTAGFSVSSGSQDGITTAGHCQSGQSYQGVSFPFVAEDVQGNQDVQWHRVSSPHVARPWAYDGIAGGSTPYYRVITGTRSRANQQIGTLVCGYGKTSHYRCGRIVWNDFAPSYIQSAQPSFMVLHHEQGEDIAEGGDSGGPWFVGGVAYGIHSGAVFAGDAIYMAINYVSSLGISVKTS